MRIFRVVVCTENDTINLVLRQAVLANPSPNLILVHYVGLKSCQAKTLSANQD